MNDWKAGFSKFSHVSILSASALLGGWEAVYAQDLPSQPLPRSESCPTPEIAVCSEELAQFLAQTPEVVPTPDAGSEPAEPLVPLPEQIEPAPATPLDLPPEAIENSPVLREWLERTPDIADEIANDPSFRTRLRLGHAQFPSSGNVSGFNAGVEDVFVWPGTGLTVSGDYARSWNGDRESYGAEARYYVFPLGGYVNFAPVVGYRQLSTPRYSTSGVTVGMRLMIIPSRGGGADVSLSQTWVAPGTDEEVGLTGASVGYAVTNRLRLSTDLQFQNSRFGQDSRLGINLEWLL
ncbi:hypothetical protein [Pseudanabaena sp. FACHB-2040]|uniref:hypothetical protein n=1 Tax=Pseudanabaena sp. FACHB-2040 TaxID=2692859 RepID=UPI001682D70D|nr:hypothetical protein [Pseudanabaena sp. FACHB-2040]MBD2256423.1 hypothetical protein [Pseudanabaena sp. FACHB-2040]